MDLNFTIPKEARESLLAAKRWSGPVTMDVLPTRNDRNMIRLAIVEEEAANIRQLLQDERELVAAWNDAEYIRVQARGESRNHPITDDEIAAHVKTIRRAIDEVGLDRLLKAMRSYMDACAAGRHIWKGQGDKHASNHGFKTLTGFLQKMMLLSKKGTHNSPWWMKGKKVVEDDHPGLTVLVADVFAQKLLGREKFGLLPGSAAYGHFRDAADRVAVVAKKNRWGLDERRVAEEMIECLRGYLRGAVSPGNLVSEHLWMVALPQHLRTRFE